MITILLQVMPCCALVMLPVWVFVPALPLQGENFISQHTGTVAQRQLWHQEVVQLSRYLELQTHCCPVVCGSHSHSERQDRSFSGGAGPLLDLWEGNQLGTAFTVRDRHAALHPNGYFLRRDIATCCRASGSQLSWLEQRWASPELEGWILMEVVSVNCS